MSMTRVHHRHGWVLPLASMVFSVLAVLVKLELTSWDEPITEWVVDNRTHALETFFRDVSYLGSTPVSLAVAALAANYAYRRCPRLAVAIVVIAVARPLIEFLLKELVDRPRPEGDRLVPGRGPSFPSGHPLATAASWGLLPLVVALYTRRRVIWWSVAVGVWVLAVLVAASRVYLGVHWATDVVASLVLAVLGVAAAERFIEATHGGPVFARRGRPDEPDGTTEDDAAADGDQPSSVRETTSART